MADFCSLCYYKDIDYDKLISKGLDELKQVIEEQGYCYVSWGVCEGCTAESIKVNKDLTIEVNGKFYIGRLNPDTYKIEIDESSDIFQYVYKEKKERHLSEMKTMNREFEAVKHIAYAIYMIGTGGPNISHHECISFEDFNPSDYSEINQMAWDSYIHINTIKNQQ